MCGPVSVTGIAVGPADVDTVVGTGLLAELDADLLARYPGEPVNGIEPAGFRQAGGYFVLARVDDELAGCGAFRPYDPASVAATTRFMLEGGQPFERGAELAAIDAPAFVVPGVDPTHPAEVADVYRRHLAQCTVAPDASALGEFLDRVL